MALFISILILSISGIVYGVKTKNKLFITISVLALIIAIGVWAYFWFNPY
ncbi:hypothetical protein [Alkalibacterium sp. 20]|nr:hypothetical protein [Alkalibacterium sp. 20]